MSLLLTLSGHGGGCSFDTVFTDEIRRRVARSARIVEGTTYTIKPSDAETDLFFSSTSPITVTVPTGLGDAFKCYIWQDSSGQVTVVNGSGATLYAYSGWKKTAGQWAGATLVHRGSNVYALAGQITA